jgi:hypothetical protein
VRRGLLGLRSDTEPFDGTPTFADKEVMREQYGKLFADSPDLCLTIASRMTAGEFVVDQEHVSGFHFDDRPIEMTVLSVYGVTDGKTSQLRLSPGAASRRSGSPYCLQRWMPWGHP